MYFREDGYDRESRGADPTTTEMPHPADYVTQGPSLSACKSSDRIRRKLVTWKIADLLYLAMP